MLRWTQHVLSRQKFNVRWQHLSQIKDGRFSELHFFFQIKTQQATVWISWTSAGTNTMMELCQLNLPCWWPWSLWDPKLLHHVQRTEAFRRRSSRAAARRAWSALPSGEIPTVKKLATDQFDYCHEHLNSEGGSNTTDLPYLCRLRLGCSVNEKKMLHSDIELIHNK